MSIILPQKKLDSYSKILLDILLDELRLGGGKLHLTRFRRLELKRAGISSQDLKRAINIAGECGLIKIAANIDGAPVIVLLKGECAK
jgi:hypothetical protein